MDPKYAKQNIYKNFSQLDEIRGRRSGQSYGAYFEKLLETSLLMDKDLL